jgi:hypothetical protein
VVTPVVCGLKVPHPQDPPSGRSRRGREPDQLRRPALDFTVNVMEFRDDRVAHERIYIMDGWEAAVWREPWRSATRADPPFPEP